jgi:hypothetical protein
MDAASAGTVRASGPQRFAASLMDWAVVSTVAFGLTRALAGLTDSRQVGRLVLAWALLVWFAWVASAASGRGLGQFVIGARVVDAGTGRPLTAARAVVRAAVQVPLSLLFALLTWVASASLIAATGIEHASSGWYSLGFVLVALTPALAEALLSLRGQRTPWDRAAHSLVISTRRSITGRS